MSRCLAIALLGGCACSSFAAQPGKNLGRPSPFAKWSCIEIALHGPSSRGRGMPNPFGILVDGIFTAPDGREFRVPGFYDGDGRGGLDGDVWKVRLSADMTGTWNFRSASGEPLLDGWIGSLEVEPVPADAAGFWKLGRLEAIGTAESRHRYLKFRDGPFWLKAGCDDPENFLGRFKHFDTPAKRHAAVDYLARKGINSLYIMVHTLEGDHRDVWPWLGDTEAEAKRHGAGDVRFDVRRLEEWRQLFEHMQTRGVVPYLVLEDDSAWKGYDHPRLYREIVARFGYLPALLFNLGEEHDENYTLADALKLMRLLAALDPFDHPRGIHNVNRPSDPYIDAPYIHFTSIQTKGKDPLAHNRLTIDWIERCKVRNTRILVVNYDEGRPEEDRRAWWSAYLAGAVWEAHVKASYDRPLTAWDDVWTQLGGTRAFVESLPFWRMEARNDLVTAGTAFCFAAPGLAYGVYLPSGGKVTLDLVPDVAYEAAWWNPANGRDGEFQPAGRVRGGRQAFAAPGPGDWALRILKGSD